MVNVIIPDVDVDMLKANMLAVSVLNVHTHVVKIPDVKGPMTRHQVCVCVL